jgi:diguanylate cyclase (GGDEF)-like protein/PAS domain S-box-containing protein
MAVLIIAHYTVPGGGIVTWALIGFSAIAARLIGVARYKPPTKIVWLILTLGMLGTLAGQLAALITTGVPLEDSNLPVAVTFYVLEYPLYIAGLVLIIRVKGLAGDLRSTVDALIITIGLGLLMAWIFLLRPRGFTLQLPPSSKMFAVAYPIGDVILLGLLARLLTPGTARGRVLQWLVVGIVGALVSDVAAGRAHIYGTKIWSPLFDLGWAITFTAWGAAALHPDMARLSRKTGPAGDPRSMSSRLVALLLTALIAPIFLLVRTVYAYQDTIERIAAVVCAVLFALVLSRLWDLNLSHERSLERERALRRAGGALAMASTVEEIGTIVRKAVRDLIRGSPSPEALLAVREDDELTVVGTPAEEVGPSRDLARLIPHWLSKLNLLEASEPKLVRAVGLPAEDKAAATRAGFESVLLCPLVLTNRPSGDPLVGVLAVLGQHKTLSSLSSALGIVANQIALAFERVLLSEEVVRQRGETLFRTLVQDALDVILVVESDMTVKYASSSATRLYGDIPIKGVKSETLVAESELIMPYSPADPATGEDVYNGLFRITRHDGKRLLVEIRSTDLRHDETVQGWVLTVRDVTEQHQLEDQLKHQAFHDALTDLPNRALFTDRAEHALSVAQRNQTFAAVLFVDLDDFKVVNDTMGHAVGDELLACVAKRLAAVTRKSDTAARLGGDEFALLIENLQDPAAAEGFADRVVSAFSEPFELSAGSVLAGATVGVATTQDSSDVGELLRHADLSLYAAKSEGKRRWHRYTSVLSAGMVKRQELQAKLEDAVAKSAFTLAYQPIVELRTGAIRGFEALVRWPTTDRGTVPPQEFIELAEETGLILPLGAWILRQAITDMARWRGTDPDPRQPSISVNVSARQFRDQGFVRGLRRCLDETGLVPAAVMLELTESSLLRNDERVSSDLDELRDLGVRLVIDDFGTGYSSLSYLRELPIDAIKIDKSFVDAITEPQGRKFVEIIVSFARAVEVDVIAEGIETEEQRTLLTGMGCVLGQGFLMARPMDWRAAELLLRSGQPLARESSRHGPPWGRP